MTSLLNIVEDYCRWREFIVCYKFNKFFSSIAELMVQLTFKRENNKSMSLGKINSNLYFYYQQELED